MFKYIKYIVCLFFISSLVSAQDSFYYKQLSDDSNRMSESVASIIKDEDGFIWIASRTGVSRYDGRNIKHYYLSQSEVMQDKDGRETLLRKMYNNKLWAFTDSGKIYYYDQFSDTFIPFVDMGLTSQSIILRDLYLDKHNTIWIASTEGLHKINATDKQSLQTIDRSISINYLSSLSDNLIGLGTTKGVLFLDTNANEIQKEKLWTAHNIMSIYYDAQHNYLWAGSFSAGLFIWDVANKKHIEAPYLDKMPNVPIKAIREWEDGLLIGLDGRGVYSVNAGKRTASLYLTNDEKNSGGGLKANSVYDILVDGRYIWVGTYSGGVSIVETHNTFEWIKHIPYNEQSVKGSHIYSILEDTDQDIWYATNAGISYYNRKTKHWKHFLEKENNFLSLCEDNNGRIWAGGYSTGLYCIDKQKGVIKHIPTLDDNTQLACIYASLNDSDGNLWFGCLYSSLAKMSTVNGKEVFEYYDIKQVKSIKEIEKNIFFVATSNGFYILNEKTGEKTHHFNTLVKYGVKSNSFIYSTLIHANEIWFGTDGGGLNCINLQTDEVHNFTTYDGLPSNYIYGILKDSKDILWISTSRGLFSFDPVAKKFLYNVANLPTDKFLFMSFAQLRDGRMAFGGTEGAILFDPKEVKNEELKPNLFFTDFRLSYQTVHPNENPQVLPKPIDQLDKIVLKHNQNSFSFGYTITDLYNSYSYEYRYKLNNFDEDWVSKGSVLSADYTNIPSGKYIFRIQSINKNDGKVLAEREITLVIKQPFWNTIWAWLFYSVVLLSFAYWVWSFYRERLLKEQSKDKIKFFVNVAHDIRTPLSLVLAPLSNLEQEQKLSDRGQEYLAMAKQNGEKLLSIVTQLLDFQKEEINPSKLNVTLCDLKKILHNKSEQFSILAERKNITLYLELPSENVYIETDVKKLERIIDNLLSNAIKYSNNYSNVFLRLKYNEKKIVLEVEDFGIGITKKNKKHIFKHLFRDENAVNSQEIGTGIGLIFTKKLAEQIKGELTFESEENRGTIFYLSFPIKDTGFVSSDNKNVAEPSKETSLTDTHPQYYYTESYRILLVEDNNDMRNYLESMLSTTYKIHSVPSAEEALLFLDKHSVDLVISDIMMDGMQGDELCRILKNDIKTSHIHVVLLTAIDEKEKMLSSFQSGADDYITKPFDVELLKVKIHNFLKSRKKLQQYFITKNKLTNLLHPLESKKVEEDVEVGSIVNLDEEFLEKCIQIVTNNLSDSEFSINDLCQEIAMSRTLVYEKLKALTGQSPNEFIRVIRLRHAMDMLETQKYSIKDVAILSGFSNSKYFSTVFKKYYGKSPSDLLDS